MRFTIQRNTWSPIVTTVSEMSTSVQLGKYATGSDQFTATIDTFTRLTMMPRTVHAAT